ncbi:MAG: glycosyltransferase family 9 protein [Deferrisomatales bacterium]|nr:glycosyltransferase family 9 protein [Deferrisomatales bacterium]
MAKVLIIKLGYSETLDGEVTQVTSLGDVLRSTVLLYPFAEDDVTWLVDEQACPLLEGNPYIRRILPYDLTAVLQLQRELYDVVVNLEKIPGICALADSVSAWRKYGFRFDRARGEAAAYDGCERVLMISRDREAKRTENVSWQEALLQIVGARWEGQEYVLGYRPKSEERFDVGLNWAVGRKWPNKAWPRDRWDELRNVLQGRYTVSMQEGMDELHAYMDWIHSCRLLVTNDSLGLHIALALRKKVVVLYGPTNPNETHFYGRAEVVYPNAERACMPCLSSRCRQSQPCMESISVEEVRRRVERLLTPDRGTAQGLAHG